MVDVNLLRYPFGISIVPSPTVTRYDRKSHIQSFNTGRLPRNTNVIMFSSSKRSNNHLDVSSYPREIIPGSGLHENLEEHVTKKSRFIGYASHVASWSDAYEIINKIRYDTHPKARHWCYAYVGDSSVGDEERSSDDGEPSGTGGAPILSAIKSSNIVNVVCVIVRYYGGIQLGTGGLIRAYGYAARDVLKLVPTQEQIPTTISCVTVPPQWIGTMYDSIQKSNSCWTKNDDTVTYNDDGSASIIVYCYTNDITRFQNSLHNLTKGNVQFSKVVH